MRREAVALRRIVFFLLCLAIAAGLLALSWTVLSGGGWTVWEALILLGIAGNLPWLAISAANGIAGLLILLLAKRPAAYVTPQLDAAAPPPPKGVTAIAVCIRNEDMAGVLPPLERLLDGLEAAGTGDRFNLWFLSDTQDPAHAAGWKVRCLPEEDGSMEGNPPAMPEFIRRDQRWAAGNMQYFALLRLPGMTAMGRWQLLQAILLFFGAPLWLLVLVAALLNVLTGGADGTPIGALVLLLLLAQAAYVGSKLPGYAEALIHPAVAARYGGRAQFAKGAGLELLFTQLFEPVRVLNQAMFLVLLGFGVKAGWAPQNRADRGVTWGDAARLLWLHTLVGLVITILAFSASWIAGLLMLPWTLSMVLAIPFCVVTSSPRASAWLRERRLCATPEELATP